MKNPLTIFQQFEPTLQIGFFTKADDIRSDAEAAKKIGTVKSAGLHQVHGNNVVIVRDQLERTIEADGMITDTPGLALCIRWADCQNFVVYAPTHNILGAMHVGWKGMRIGMIPAFFDFLQKKFSIAGADCFVGAGPSLCMRCAEFTDPITEIPNVPKKFVHGRHVDLQSWADTEFYSEGVQPERLERHPDCTRCHPDKYWTYRGGDREDVLQGHTNMSLCALRKN